MDVSRRSQFIWIPLVWLYISILASSVSYANCLTLEACRNDNARLMAENAQLRRGAPKTKAVAPQASSPTAVAAPLVANPSPPPKYGTLLLRKDNLEASDILFQNTIQQTADAKGASFNWTNNYIQKTNNVAVQGYLTWALPSLFYPDPSTPRYGTPNALNIDSAVLAPFSYLNGSLTNPYNPKTEKSAAQFGLNAELALNSPAPLTLTSFSLLPYYQTDFRGHASIAGFQALIEPYSPKALRLGGASVTGGPEPFAWYWRLIGEANPIWVDNAGLTSFHSNTTYALLGATTQLRGVLFANTPSVGSALCGRISVLGSFQPMWNVSNHTYLNGIHAEVDYDLVGKKTPFTLHCPGIPQGGQDSEPKNFYEAQSFDASLSFTYDTGVDFSTYQKTNKMMVGLTLLY
jgi:hypothetical protein